MASTPYYTKVETAALIGTGNILPKYPTNFDKIGFSGTSITNGGAFPLAVVQTLSTVLERAITHYNGAVWGASSTSQLGTLPSIISQNPEIIILEISINDANGSTIPYATSKSNYISMINLCRASNVIPILMTCFPIDLPLMGAQLPTPITGFTQEKRTDLCNLARALSIQYGVQLIDIDMMSSQSIDLLFDGLHLNTKGNLFATNVISGEIIKQATVI